MRKGFRMNASKSNQFTTSFTIERKIDFWREITIQNRPGAEDVRRRGRRKGQTESWRCGEHPGTISELDDRTFLQEANKEIF